MDKTTRSPGPPGLTPRQRLERRLEMMKNERASWDANWRELSDFILPMRSRFLVDQTNRGDRRNGKIINNTATMASRTMASGMMSGITSPARPWFNQATPDKALMEYGLVKTWFYEVTRRMREVFLASNLYQVLPTCYQEMGTFGTGAIWIDEDPDTVIRCDVFTIGEYYAANGYTGRVDTFAREYRATVAQLVSKFGYRACSGNTQRLYDQGSLETWIDCVQFVEPNQNHKPGSNISKQLPFIAITYEMSGSPNEILEEKGYYEFPVMVPRWDLMAGDVWGTGPGRVCIGDVKALQLYERQAARMTETGANPALMASSQLEGKASSALPGSITYVDQVGGQNQMVPIYQPDYGWLNPVTQKIQQHEARINEAYFADLFLMVSQLETVRSATEIVARKEEKMLMLGPVLERINDELLDPLTDRTFNIMLRQSIPIWEGIMEGTPLLPEPPEELIQAGGTIRSEYISILAQAQKAQNVTALERFAGFVGNLAGAFPDVADKMDGDQLVDEYAESIGVVPTVVRGDEQVAMIRQQRAQALAQAEQQQALANGIQGAKLLSETELTPNNVLGQLTGA